MEHLQLDNSETICAISTAPGRGAIALVRVSGPKAIEITDSLWNGRRLVKADSHTAHLGTLTDGNGNDIDQCVATVYRAPRSFTSEDTVEIALHGSSWIQKKAIDVLCSSGCRLAHPGEFTRRAVKAGRIDITQAEAIGDLIAASSEAAHKAAMGQLRGTVKAGIEQLRARLLELAGLLELELDFSDMDVEFVPRQELLDAATGIRRHIGTLLKSFSCGNAIKEGFPIAIVGPVNSGKSKLLNTILGDDKAIVSNIPGTTRDIVEDTIAIGPYTARILDTAGLRHTSDTIEQIGIQRAREAAAKAGIVLYVIDASNPRTTSEIEADTAGLDSGKIIYVVNKTDITSHTPDLPATDTVVHISALNNEGIDSLLAAVAAKIDSAVKTSADSEGLIITNIRHAQALEQAHRAINAVIDGLASQLTTDLVAEELRQTIHHLSTITGAIPPPEILQSIFSNFCVGK